MDTPSRFQPYTNQCTNTSFLASRSKGTPLLSEHLNAEQRVFTCGGFECICKVAFLYCRCQSESKKDVSNVREEEGRKWHYLLSLSSYFACLLLLFFDHPPNNLFNNYSYYNTASFRFLSLIVTRSKQLQGHRQDFALAGQGTTLPLLPTGHFEL